MTAQWFHDGRTPLSVATAGSVGQRGWRPPLYCTCPLCAALLTLPWARRASYRVCVQPSSPQLLPATLCAVNTRPRSASGLLAAYWGTEERVKLSCLCSAVWLHLFFFPLDPALTIRVQRLRRRLGCVLQLTAFPGAAGVLLHELRGTVLGVFALIWLVLLLHTCGVYHAVSPERFWYKLLKVIVYAE